jgi:RNA polymerase sigma-70 factor (ECF subfamily)
MLGSMSDAEDIVQDAFLRWRDAASVEIRSDSAYLTTVVARLCLDHLNTARSRRLEYVGPWLPEPVAIEPADPETGPNSESLSFAFLVLLESLTPQERAIYLLHEVFDYGHREIAAMLDLSELHCRQLLRRARKHIVDRRPRFAPTREAHKRLVTAFAGAVAHGNVQELQALLADDVTSWLDGGGKATTARKPLFGARAVARFYSTLGRNAPTDSRMRAIAINGWPALATFVGDTLISVVDLETDGERIHCVRTVVNPDKLAAIRSYLAEKNAGKSDADRG